MTACIRSVLCLFGVVLLAGLCRASESLAVDSGYVLPGPDAPIYTVAGGGGARPKVGRPATAVRLHPREAVFIGDGRIVIRDSEYADEGRLIAVGRPDGSRRCRPSALGPTTRTSSAIRCRPRCMTSTSSRTGACSPCSAGSRAWSGSARWWSPVPAPKDVRAAAALPDGGILALTDGKAWWLTRDGTVVTSRRLPNGINGTEEFTESVTPLPGGGLVAGSVGGEVYAVLGRPGRPSGGWQGSAGTTSDSTISPTGR